MKRRSAIVLALISGAVRGASGTSRLKLVREAVDVSSAGSADVGVQLIFAHTSFTTPTATSTCSTSSWRSSAEPSLS